MALDESALPEFLDALRAGDGVDLIRVGRAIKDESVEDLDIADRVRRPCAIAFETPRGSRHQLDADGRAEQWLAARSMVIEEWLACVEFE